MKTSGFTLAELVVCLAIVSVLLMFTISLSDFFYQKNKVNTVADEIKNAVQYARIMALKNDTPLTLNPLPETGNWSEGMILFTDNPRHHYTQKDRVIHQWQWKLPGVQVVWKGFRSTHFLTLTTVLKQASSNGYFLITNHQNYQKKLIVNRIGHTRFERENEKNK